MCPDELITDEAKGRLTGPKRDSTLNKGRLSDGGMSLKSL